jgi:hypothetical protein
MFLEAERLLLKPLRAADVPAVAWTSTDSAATEYLGGPRNFEELWASLARDAQAEPPPQFDLWPVIENVTRHTVRHCGTQIRLSIFTFYVLRHPYHGA